MESLILKYKQRKSLIKVGLILKEISNAQLKQKIAENELAIKKMQIELEEILEQE